MAAAEVETEELAGDCGCGCEEGILVVWGEGERGMRESWLLDGSLVGRWELGSFFGVVRGHRGCGGFYDDGLGIVDGCF